MRIWSVRGTVVLLLILATTGMIHAQGNEDPPVAGAMRCAGWAGDLGPGFYYEAETFRSPAHWRAMTEFLGLSKDQVGKMHEVWTRYFLETRDMRYDLIQKRLEMHKLFTDPKVNAATLLAKEKEISTLREKLFMKRAQMLVDERAIMTLEQIWKLDFMPRSLH